MSIRFLAQQHFPTREEIQQRMERRLGWVPLLTCILGPCAEEAERIMHELWLEEAERPKAPEPPEKMVRIIRVTTKHYHRHHCPECQTQNIYPSHNYCPKCGTKILWIEQEKY